MARGAPDYAVNRVGARAYFGFDCLAEFYATDTGGAPIEYLDGDVVPANKVWRLTTAMAWNEDAATLRIMMRARTTLGFYPIVTETNVPQQVGVHMQGEIFLEEGDWLQAAFVGTAAVENLYLSAHGTEIDVEV